MKKLMTVALVVSGLFYAGCDKKPADAAGEGANAPAGALPAPGDAKEVVAKVGDVVLTRGEIDADVAKFIEARKAQIPPDQIAQAKDYLFMQLKQQFVTKTLLLNEAKKKDVSVTDAEVAEQGNKMIKSYQGRPGAPATMEAMFAAHPLGAERARADFRESVLINKFVEQEIGSKVKVDPEELKKQYNEIVSNVTESAKALRPEMVRASHILVKTGEGKTDEAAKKEIDALYAQVKDLKGDALKTKFAELAKEKSDCPSKDKGGDLGAFRHGQMVPEFDKAAFAQEVGKVYEAIKTSFGWHLILVSEKIPAKAPTAAEVEKLVAERKPKIEDVERMMKNQQMQQKFQKYLQDLLKTSGLMPPAPQKPAAKPRPAQKIESKPVEVKPIPAPAKPAEAKKPAEPAKPAAPAKPAEAKK